MLPSPSTSNSSEFQRDRSKAHPSDGAASHHCEAALAFGTLCSSQGASWSRGVRGPPTRNQRDPGPGSASSKRRRSVPDPWTPVAGEPVRSLSQDRRLPCSWLAAERASVLRASVCVNPVGRCVAGRGGPVVGRPAGRARTVSGGGSVCNSRLRWDLLPAGGPACARGGAPVALRGTVPGPLPECQLDRHPGRIRRCSGRIPPLGTLDHLRGRQVAHDHAGAPLMRRDGNITTNVATAMVTIGFGLMFVAWNGAAGLDYVPGAAALPAVRDAARPGPGPHRADAGAGARDPVLEGRPGRAAGQAGHHRGARGSRPAPRRRARRRTRWSRPPPRSTTRRAAWSRGAPT